MTKTQLTTTLTKVGISLLCYGLKGIAEYVKDNNPEIDLDTVINKITEEEIEELVIDFTS